MMARRKSFRRVMRMGLDGRHICLQLRAAFALFLSAREHNQVCVEAVSNDHVAAQLARTHRYHQKQSGHCLIGLRCYQCNKLLSWSCLLVPRSCLLQSNGISVDQTSFLHRRMQVLVKVPLKRAHLAESIKKTRSDRQGFVDLAAFLEWLWDMTVVPERYCCEVCMWLMDKLATLQMEDAMQTGWLFCLLCLLCLLCPLCLLCKHMPAMFAVPAMPAMLAVQTYACCACCCCCTCHVCYACFANMIADLSAIVTGPTTAPVGYATHQALYSTVWVPTAHAIAACPGQHQQCSVPELMIGNHQDCAAAAAAAC